MTALRVEVTAEDIANAGDDRMAWAQPVEDALAALTGQEVGIDAGGHDETPWSIATIGQGDWTIVVDLPPSAHAWLDRRWDGDPDDRLLGSEPFAFDLEVPAWLAAFLPPVDLVTLAEASRALGTIKPQGLRTAAQQRRDGIASEKALAARLGMRRIGRDWLVPRDRLEAEVARRAEAAG